MYPTISHFIYDITGNYIGLPIMTFGFWIAIAFLIGAWIITLEFKRKEKEGKLMPFDKEHIEGDSIKVIDLINPIIFGFFLGFKGIESLLYYEDLVNNPQSFILSSRGNLIGGVLLSILFSSYRILEINKNKLLKPKIITKKIFPHELVGNIIMVAAISGIIGAKFFDILQADKTDDSISFLSHCKNQLFTYNHNTGQHEFMLGGLTFYGGLIFGTIAVLSYSYKYKINFRHLIDSFSPALILAYGIGRIGCQMSGDGCWGTQNNLIKPDFLSFLPDWMWSYNFPHNVNKDGVVINECNETLWNPYCYELPYNVWPTAFYETIMSFIIFFVLWKIRKKITVSGVLFFIYLILNGMERFLIENLRDHDGLDKYDIFGGIYQAQIISFSLIIIGLSGVLYYYKEKISNKFIK